MPFSVQVVQQCRVLEADSFGGGGRIVALQVGTVQITGATRRQEAVRLLSAGVLVGPLLISQLNTLYGKTSAGSALLVWLAVGGGREA